MLNSTVGIFGVIGITMTTDRHRIGMRGFGLAPDPLLTGGMVSTLVGGINIVQIVGMDSRTVDNLTLQNGGLTRIRDMSFLTALNRPWYYCI